jgi:hypothetical protein
VNQSVAHDRPALAVQVAGDGLPGRQRGDRVRGEPVGGHALSTGTGGGQHQDVPGVGVDQRGESRAPRRGRPDAGASAARARSLGTPDGQGGPRDQGGDGGPQQWDAERRRGGGRREHERAVAA